MPSIRVLVLLCLAGVVFTSPKTRKTQPECEIVINEVSFGSLHGPFVEIAKLCPPGVRANDKVKLGGFLLLLLDTSTLNVLFIQNLHRKSLKLLDYNPDAESVPGQIRHSKIGVPSRKRKKPSEAITTTESTFTTTPAPSVDFDSVSLPCELNFDCLSEKKRKLSRRSLDNSTRSEVHLRRRRQINDQQKNVRAVYLQKLSSDLDRTKSQAVLLLKLPKNRAEIVDGRKNFVLGSPVNEMGLDDIKTYLHDYILLNPSELVIDQREILKFLDETNPLSFIEIPSHQPSVSISKCDSIISTVDPSGFIYTTQPTPSAPNHCKTYQLQPFRFRGTNFNVQAKKLMANTVVGLRDYKNDPSWQRLNEAEAASTLLNVHKSTLYRLMNEFAETGALSPPKKMSKTCSVTEIDPAKKKLLYDSISSFFKQNQVPYFQNVYEEFMRRVNEQREQDEEEYKCSASSFKKIIRKNYRYGRIKERDAVLFKSYNIERRKRYLERIANHDANKDVDVYYQDETWIDPYARCQKAWVPKKFCSFQERKDFTFANAKIARGPRIIILGIGGVNGFVPGTTEIYLVSKSKVQNDYHGNINGKKFYDWIEKVLTKFQRKSIIVFDNSPVHSVSTAPTSAMNKPEFLQWLDEKYRHQTTGYQLIPPDYKTKTKAELWEIVKSIKNEYPQYKIDDLIRERGHEAIRLPPYQADLNPIEYVWSDVKRESREKNTEQNARKTLEIARQILEKYTAAQWAKHIGHVKRVEQEYREGDAAFERMTREQPIIEEQFIDVEPDEQVDENEDDGDDGGC